MFDTRAALGVAHKAFDMIDVLLEGALTLMEQCDCEVGCPSCTVTTARRRPMLWREG